MIEFLLLFCVVFMITFWALFGALGMIALHVQRHERSSLKPARPNPRLQDQLVSLACCTDCGMPMPEERLSLSEALRCDLCTAIWQAELDYYGFSRFDHTMRQELG